MINQWFFIFYVNFNNIFYKYKILLVYTEKLFHYFIKFLSFRIWQSFLLYSFTLLGFNWQTNKNQRWHSTPRRSLHTSALHTWALYTSVALLTLGTLYVGCTSHLGHNILGTLKLNISGNHLLFWSIQGNWISSSIYLKNA